VDSIKKQKLTVRTDRTVGKCTIKVNRTDDQTLTIVDDEKLNTFQEKSNNLELV
jgi:hypothetical protein